MILLILGTLLVLFLFNDLYWKRRNLPPGPTPWPLLGNSWSLYFGFPGYDYFLKWRKQYGPVYTFWLSVVPEVMICDWKTMKETIVKDGEKYTGRYNSESATKLMRGGKYGIIETDGDLWREQRRFALHILRDFGMGKNGMEERVLQEVDAMVERISLLDEVNMTDEFNLSVGSIINNILFGYRYEGDKMEEYHRLRGCLNDWVKEFSNPIANLVFFWPFTRSLPYFKGKFQRLEYFIDGIMGYFGRQIEEKERKLDLESEESADFIDYYLKEKHRRRDEPDFGGYSMIQLKNVIFDLWSAGLETTSTTLNWTVVYILNHPEVQKKMHEELDRVVGRDRKTVTLADRNQLVYVNATICEAQRLTNLLPHNLLRQTVEEVEILGRKYPKGTIVVPQISCLLYDDEVFPDPYKFDPTRFIDSEGKLKRFEEFLPFSLGKRQCPGEGLARMELYLFTANLFHRYEVHSDSPPSMKKDNGMTLTPHPYNCKLRERL